MESKENLLSIAKKMENKHRKILIDLRGHGESSVPHCPYSLDDFSFDIVEIIKSEFGSHNVTLTGRSMGGMIIANTYLKIQNQCSRLIFLNSSIKFKEYNVSAYLIDTLLPNLLLIKTSNLTRFARLAFGLRAKKSDLELVKTTLDESNKKVAYLSYRNSISKLNLIDSMKKCKILVLSLRGGLDTILPSGHAKYIASIVDNGFFRFYPQCGHFSNLEVQEDLILTLTRFFELTGS